MESSNFYIDLKGQYELNEVEDDIAGEIAGNEADIDHLKDEVSALKKELEEIKKKVELIERFLGTGFNEHMEREAHLLEKDESQ